MHTRTDIHSLFHIDLDWWQQRGRSLRRFLASILDEDEADLPESAPLDYIDPETAEVYQLDPTWVRVLLERAHRPDYISTTTPLTNAVLRALIENVNRPMSAVELHRRISRGSPETVLRVLATARREYGIVPAGPDAPGPSGR
jgi:hypothetical protein